MRMATWCICTNAIVRVQLRNQKVVEVAPAPGLADALRQRILADAIRLVEAANYVNAGTVEFW